MKKIFKLKNISALCIFITMVAFLLTGCQFRDMEDPENKLHPVSPNPKTEEKTVVLYFADDQGENFVPEFRKVKFAKDDLPSAIIKELIRGPKTPGLSGTLPENLRLLSLSVSNGIAYVNFSREFENEVHGSSGTYFALGSIIRSLTELEDINMVRLMTEGKIMNELDGSMDLRLPFEREVGLGTKEQDKDKMNSEQAKADKGELSWRLNPVETARQEGISWFTYGLEEFGGTYAFGEYKLLSQKETGEAVVIHKFKGKSYEINLNQPVKKGKKGIWAIKSMYPIGTQEEAITQYLEESYIYSQGLVGTRFLAYDILSEENSGNKTQVYIWMLSRDYELEEDRKITFEQSMSIPLALTLMPVDERNWKVTDCLKPGEKENYADSVRNILPAGISEKLLSKKYDEQKLGEQIQKKARDYYNKVGINFDKIFKN